MAPYSKITGGPKEDVQSEVAGYDQTADPEHATDFSRPRRATWRWPSLGCWAIIFSVLILLAMTVGLVVDCLDPSPNLSPQSNSSDASPARIPLRNNQVSLPSEPTDEELSCGETRKEAETRGCILDVLANAWTPKLCYDAVTAAAAQLPDSKLAHLDAAGTYQFYQDSNHTIPLTYEQLTQLDSLKAYVLKGWHISHCLYEWRGAADAINRLMMGEHPVWVRSTVLDREHVDHCNEVLAKQIVDPIDWDIAGFGLGSCTRLDVERKTIQAS